MDLSVQFSHSVVSNSLWPHEPQHTRPPCPSPTPGVHANPCPLSQWCHPTISSSHPLLLLPSVFPSISVFSDESALHISWPNYWSFSIKISPTNEYPGLISFRMDWLDLFAVQGTLKSLLQHHSSKALRWPRGMVRGRRGEGCSGWGTHVYLWRIHVDVWQNQYSIVK